jgi:hypothetical protein
MSESSESEVLAQELDNIGSKLLAFERRLAEVEKVIRGLEEAALNYRPRDWRRFPRIGTRCTERCAEQSEGKQRLDVRLAAWTPHSGRRDFV